ncbi:MAG TPA: L-rhamnose mutarotase, partial [Parafilimonas sp.]|nr:L-rhamnose mutarotase [Parafilimonas sp.]
MRRVAFKMKLFKGYEAEYKKRHDELWNDLKQLLKQTGVADYSIFFDKETNFLFAYLTIDDAKNLDALSKEPLMKK